MLHADLVHAFEKGFPIQFELDPDDLAVQITWACFVLVHHDPSLDPVTVRQKLLDATVSGQTVGDVVVYYHATPVWKTAWEVLRTLKGLLFALSTANLAINNAWLHHILDLPVAGSSNNIPRYLPWMLRAMLPHQNMTAESDLDAYHESSALRNVRALVNGLLFRRDSIDYSVLLEALLLRKALFNGREEETIKTAGYLTMFACWAQLLPSPAETYTFHDWLTLLLKELREARALADQGRLYPYRRFALRTPGMVGLDGEEKYDETERPIWTSDLLSNLDLPRPFRASERIAAALAFALHRGANNFATGRMPSLLLRKLYLDHHLPPAPFSVFVRAMAGLSGPISTLRLSSLLSEADKPRQPDIEQFIRFCQTSPAVKVGSESMRSIVQRSGVREPNLRWDWLRTEAFAVTPDEEGVKEPQFDPSEPEPGSCALCDAMLDEQDDPAEDQVAALLATLHQALHVPVVACPLCEHYRRAALRDPAWLHAPFATNYKKAATELRRLLPVLHTTHPAPPPTVVRALAASKSQPAPPPDPNELLVWNKCLFAMRLQGAAAFELHLLPVLRGV